MPLELLTISFIGISMLVPLGLVIIPAVGIPVPVPPTIPVIIPPVVTPVIIPPIVIPVISPLPILAVPTIAVAIGLLVLPVLAVPTVAVAIRLLPLPVLAIPTIGVAIGLLVLPVLAVPAIGVAIRLLPLTILAIPAIGVTIGLLVLPVLAVPAIGVAIRLLPLTWLTIPPISLGTRLEWGKSLAIWLRGKPTERSSLGAQGAQRHKQSHRENNAPPSFGPHLIILLKINLQSRFVNLEGRPREKVKELLRIFKNYIARCRINLEVRAGRNRVGVA